MSAAVNIEAFLKPDLERHSFRFVAKPRADSRPLYLLRPGDALPESLPQAARSWAKAQGFDGTSGAFALLPDENGQICGAVFGIGAAESADICSSAAPVGKNPFAFGSLAAQLPSGGWHFSAESMELLEEDEAYLACLSMVLGSYRFRLGKQAEAKQIEFTLPKGMKGRKDVDSRWLSVESEAIFLTRNLINLPANIMTCDALEQAAQSLAERFGAKAEVIKGEALAEQNLPLIHTVGRAGAQAPRLVSLTWDGRENGAGRHIALVGKGVCFDTGGLDIKSAAGMTLMKKDMGGAAHVLGLAQMIMARKHTVKLSVYLPIVENAISGNAFRPGDILTSRTGLTIEIGNTDAEGRLILADALALACESAPDILIDMATLTGAARTALGPEIAPFYCNDSAFAGKLQDYAAARHDPLWQLPLWPAYSKNLASAAADINNVTKDGFAGSITAALFLSRFVSQAKIWVHCDIYGWRTKAAPGFPEGGDAQGISAFMSLFEKDNHDIEQKYRKN